TTRVRDGVGVISAIEGRILGSRGAYGAVHHSVRICAVKSETARVLTVLPTERICSGFPGPIIYLHNGGPIRPIGLGSRNLDTVLVDMDPAIVARPIHPLPGIGVRVSVPILLHGVLIAPYSFSLLPFVRLSLSSIAALGRARAIATPIIGLEVQLKLLWISAAVIERDCHLTVRIRRTHLNLVITMFNRYRFRFAINILDRL